MPRRGEKIYQIMRKKAPLILHGIDAAGDGEGDGNKGVVNKSSSHGCNPERFRAGMPDPQTMLTEERKLRQVQMAILPLIYIS